MLTREKATEIYRARQKYFVEGRETEALIGGMTRAQEEFVSEVRMVLKRYWKRASWMDAFNQIMWGKVERRFDGISIDLGSSSRGFASHRNR